MQTTRRREEGTARSGGGREKTDLSFVGGQSLLGIDSEALAEIFDGDDVLILGER